MNEYEELNSRLVQEPIRGIGGKGNQQVECPPSQPISSADNPMTINAVCWQVAAGGRYSASGETVNTLPAGVYKIDADPYGRLWLLSHKVNLDSIVTLPEESSKRVLTSVRTFWERKAAYVEFGLLHKRGILLWGPPGSGKTVTINILMRDLVESGGIVIITENPRHTGMMLGGIRKIEPERPIINIMEDIDEMISQFGEHEILATLDGENQISNVVQLATTNYPERLGARIINRPTRFDEVIMVGMPSAETRQVYLDKFGVGTKSWVQDTEGFSIAHLREMIAATQCLGVSYESALLRLKSMMKRPKDIEGFDRNRIGL